MPGGVDLDRSGPATGPPVVGEADCRPPPTRRIFHDRRHQQDQPERHQPGYCGESDCPGEGFGEGSSGPDEGHTGATWRQGRRSRGEGRQGRTEADTGRDEGQGGRRGEAFQGAGKTTAKPTKAPSGARKTRTGTKQEQLIAMLRRPEGMTVEEATTTFGWQPHTVRGALYGALKKKLGLDVTSEKVEGRGRVYRIGS